MFLRFLRSKILLLFLVLFFIGFIAGYDYALLTSGEPPNTPVKGPVIVPYDDSQPLRSDETLKNEDTSESGG